MAGNPKDIMDTTVPVSVVIPTFRRVDSLIKTLLKIACCSPLPAEIIVHIDGGDNLTAPAIQPLFPSVILINSTESVGPGGGRNKGIAASNYELIASFDDDSYPVQQDYFYRLHQLFESIPEAAVIESLIFHRNEEQPKEIYQCFLCHIFTGCGVAYRKSWYLKIGGYVPVPIAYGLEEVDFAMRANKYNAVFIRTAWLTVFHDTVLQHHNNPQINAASIRNLGTLAYLRYPFILWPYGVLQIFNRVLWSIVHKRYKGIFNGLYSIPNTCFRLNTFRSVLSLPTIKAFLKNRSVIHPYELPSSNRRGIL